MTHMPCTCHALVHVTSSPVRAEFGPGGNLEIENHVMALGSGAPTDATRRMAQTMALARKVIAQQKELERIQKALEDHQVRR
jgi:hypothetical protein